MAGSWNIRQGLNAVGAYQVSGAPFATASIVANGVSAAMIGFPYVTRWFQVYNHDGFACQVGFSELGVRDAPYPGYGGKNYFTVDASGSNGIGKSPVLELKVSQLWLTGSSNVEVIAGLTSIPAASTSGSAGPNWSGSSGVG